MSDHLRVCVTVPPAEDDPKANGIQLQAAYDLVRRYVTVRIGEESAVVEIYDLFKAVKACMEANV